MARAAIEHNRAELEDLEWLATSKDEVLQVLSWLRRAAALKQCQADTGTYAVTIKNGELTDAFVTEAFCDRFEDELDALKLRTLKIKLASLGGVKGQRRFGIRFDAVSSAVAVADVASEGEQRCIALAAFLAELSQASHRSALVFDDPVSSLDHVHRAAVAQRLAAEARVRQVIIFTHDPVFLRDLIDSAEDLDVAPTCLFLSWGGGRPGQCEKNLPHDWQKHSERIDAAEKEAAALAHSWNKQPSTENVAAMRSAYSRFRATIEKVVEEVVFAGVVVRYRSYIKLTPPLLKSVVGFADSECDELLRLHKKCCDLTEAHDPAAGKQTAIPSPEELRDDVNALRSVVDQIKMRRKARATSGGVPAP